MTKAKNEITTFGEQIRGLREDLNLSMREVAKSINIDTSLLGRIERNERQPTKEQVKALSKYFKINEKDLIKEVISDLIAYKILDEEVDLDTLKVVEQKVEYIKAKREKK